MARLPTSPSGGRRRRLVPLKYPVRSLIVRWQASILSALGIAMTIAVLCGVFALRTGFEALHADTGADDVAVYLRSGATSEGESGIPLDRVNQYKVRPEVVLDGNGQPLAAGECYLALFLHKADGGGLVNVPIRGVEPASFEIHGDDFKLLPGGRKFNFGADEIIVGLPTSQRIRDCQLGQTLIVNVTPFKVVGIFEHAGAYRSEIWGDVDRITAALERPMRQRVIAKVQPGTDVERIAEELSEDKRLPSKVASERAYFAAQTDILGGVLGVLGTLLAGILGIAAVLGAANTMLAAVGARTHEVGVLRSIGFGQNAILLAFLFEAALIGLAGGIIGCLLVLPLNGMQTGTMNWNTFTESAFAFQVDGPLLTTAIVLSLILGVLGGLIPAWKASRLPPVEAMRRQ
ncbi:MAG: ABC transporter permease [Planctomycetota bacterium]|nr:ABC transporter permease [Planctomycetota bacterium]